MTAYPPWLDEAKDRFVQFEGQNKDSRGRHQLYRCESGKLTIGHGHNIDDLGISDAVADLILEEDIRDALAELDQRIPWWRDQPKGAGIVILDLMLNMGWMNEDGGGLHTFKATLPAIRDGQYEFAANLLLRSQYARQVGARAKLNAAMLRRATDGE